MVTKPLCTSCMHFSRCTFSRSRLILSGLCASPSLIPLPRPHSGCRSFSEPEPTLVCSLVESTATFYCFSPSVVRSPNPLVDTSCFHRVLYHSHGLSPVFACNVILSRSGMTKCVIGLLHFGRLARRERLGRSLLSFESFWMSSMSMRTFARVKSCCVVVRSLLGESPEINRQSTRLTGNSNSDPF
jgi:hypothetical protein